MNLKSFVPSSGASVAILCLLCITPALAQMVDANGNGMSDVWEWVYGATNLPPAMDSDNDGVSNINEAQAGTDPFNPSSMPQISPLAVSPTNAVISMAAQLGKLYQLQSNTNLGSTNWLTETSTVVRAGTNFAFPSPLGGTMKFYRVLVSDVDTDGDGVNDWEEYKLGLDPSNAMSNATLDGNGIAMADYQYVTNMMAQQNVITIAATDPVTVQPDPGQSATDLGVFTFTRGGFALNALTVRFTLGTNAGCAKEGVDHATMARSVTLPIGTVSKTVSVLPLADTNLLSPVIALVQLLPGTNYMVGGASNAAVVIYPSAAPGGTGLTAWYYTNSSTTYSSANNFNPANLITNRIDPVVDVIWVTNNNLPNLSNGLYSVRWTGQVQPQYSETYFFVVNSDDGCKLWVNDQLIIDNWASKSASDLTGTIALQAGAHYDLKLEYLQFGGSAQAHLSWYSADQSKQAIPSNRLYATNSSSGGATSNGLPTITSALSAVGFAGQPFSFTVTAANTPQRFTATNLPPGLVFNITNGLISGTPSLAGDYQVPLTASNVAGISASVVDIFIYNTGGAASIEIWTNAPGINISDIPLGTLPNATGAFTGLDGITNYGDNYGERIRGYFIAPATTNYYFWAAGSDSVQFWLSDDNEPVNKLLRCWVTPTNNPTASGLNGTSPHQWNLQSKQRSGWLALNAGQKYYFEILHKAGVGTNDHWSVGWLLDPTGTNTVPAGVTPPYLVARYFTPLPVNIPGSLYTANMLALPGVASSSVGSATLRLSSDGSQAVLNYSVNISGTHVDHIYSDPYLTYPTTLVFDIAAAHPQTDGSYLWKINPAPPFSTADIQEALIEGKCSIVIQTPAYPAGEIGGHFTLASGAQIFTAPPNPPAWTDDSATTNGAVRFLTQATFGAGPADIALVQAIGYTNWINNQLALPATHALGIVQTNQSADPSNIFPSSDWFNAWWQNSVTAPDQLRQRVAFALSEIMVASESGTLQDHSDALAYYYDALLDNSFGNFRALLKSVSLTPAMGLYLNMQGNDKGSLTAGTHANENYAREINQLFSVGLNRLWPDGSLVLNSSGSLVPTYNQSVVSGFAQTFTGWNYFQTNSANGRLPTNTFSPAVNYTNPMTLFPLHHDLNAKLLLDNVTLPPAWGAQTNTLATNLDNYGLQDFEQALDAIYNHPNVGPFVCRELIQRLVTSNPSRGYLYRVVQKFNDNGSGVRGDMAAVVKAILLDPEARDPSMVALTTFGKQREPLLRVTATARAFPSPPNLTGLYSESGSQTISITMPQPHRMNNNDTVVIGFADTSGNPAPPSQSYGISWTGSNTFNVTCPNLATGSYTQNTNVITVNISGHGLSTGNAAYLVFNTGGAVNGLYLITGIISANSFTVSTPDGAVRSGNCLMPKIAVSGFVQNGTNVTISCAGPHGLVTNETLYIVFNSATPVTGQYQVKGIPDALHFTVVATNSTGQTVSGSSVYPLGPPALTRAGNATVQWSTWNMGYTDNGSTYNLAQSPLSPNTVFNFFFPAYEFPGPLSAAGLTTPEFQLTSDTSVALQMNFLESGLFSNSNNTNGLSSFTANNGGIVLDIGPWMTTNYTSAAGIPVLVDNLNSVLLAGQLNNAARTGIINYVTNTANFTYGAPPTQAQIRDRVNAVIHLLICSPDFTIQK